MPETFRVACLQMQTGNDLAANLDTVRTMARAAARKSPRESDYIEALAAFYADSDKLDHRSRALAYSKRKDP